jgi:hypothetical protein
MNQLRATALRLLTSAALSSGAGCQAALRSTHPTDVPPAVCYHLEFGPWSAADQAPFAKAAAGLVSPVPDTIALAARVITRYGRAYHVALKLPLDSMGPTGTWIQISRDTLVVDLPSDARAGLSIRLLGSGEQLRGVAGVVFLHPEFEGKNVVLYDPIDPPGPWANVTALRVACASAFDTSSPGA